MKYFTVDLWNKINSEIKEERVTAREEWKKNDINYSNIFNEVKTRLPKYFLKIFMNEHGFHDYDIKKYEIIHGNKGYKNPIQVNLIIGNGDFCWEINYKYVSRIKVNYKEQVEGIDKGRQYYRGFDNYGYNEILPVTDKVLSHEILFTSDATILVHFKKVSIKKVME